MHIVVKAMKYLRKYFCSCLNYVVFLFENIHVFLSKSGERNTDFQFPDFIYRVAYLYILL